MQPPRFWYPQLDENVSPFAKVIETFLRPAGLLYDAISRLQRTLSTSYTSAVPIVCVGNLSVGGTGKTPVALCLAETLRRLGHTPYFLTRGYGGTIKGPVQVDVDRNTAKQVGDEALLLASCAPTIVSRDRPLGAALAAQEGASIVVMDDGFQNPSLQKDLSFVVVDAAAQFGNRLVFPAGPLRETVRNGLARADAVLVVHSSAQEMPCELSKVLKKELNTVPPVFDASLTAQAADLKPYPYLAFAGIGRPQKFFQTLRDLETELVTTRAFPDHHMYTNQELDDLRRLAAQRGAKLITTEKDAMRLNPEWRRIIETLRVELSFSDPKGLDEFIQKKLNLAEKKR